MEGIALGCVLVQHPSGSGTEAFFAEVAQAMVKQDVRVICLMAVPYCNLKESARRLCVCLQTCLASTVVEYPLVRHVVSSHGDSVHYVVVGRNSGFSGDLLPSSTVVEGLHQKAQWKEALFRQSGKSKEALCRQSGKTIWTTLDSPLPPALCKIIYATSTIRMGCFPSVWFKGHGRRSSAAAERRHLRDILRYSNQQYYKGMQKAAVAEALGDADEAEALASRAEQGPKRFPTWWSK